jgi:hypothetical protein
MLRLLQRYQNVKMELEAQQNLERIRMEKLVQSGALLAPRKHSNNNSSSSNNNGGPANASSSNGGGGKPSSRRGGEAVL